jgi:hypothetical protein
MSTDLYRVRVLSVEAEQMACQVEAVYPDVGLPPSRTLAFQFLLDIHDRLGRGGVSTGTLSFGLDGPLTPDEARNLAGRSSLAALLGLPTDDWLDEGWILAHASRVVRSVEVAVHPDDPEGERGKAPDLTVPRATYAITATDPRWLDHVRPGMSWQTTAYPIPEGE